MNIPKSIPTTLSALVFSSGLAIAADITWNGSTDNNWSEASNWTPASVPNLSGTGSDNAFVGGIAEYDGVQAGDFFLNNGNSLTMTSGGSWEQINGVAWIQAIGGTLNVNNGGSFNTGTAGNIVIGTGTTFNIAGTFNTNSIAMGLTGDISMYLTTGANFINTAGNFIINSADATFHLSGGTASIGEFNAINGDMVISGGTLNTSIISFNDAAQASSFDLSGGRINVASNNFQGIYAIGEDDYVNFTIGGSGSLYIEGITEGEALLLTTDGRLRYDDAIGNISFSESGSGYLFTGPAVPEPSTYAGLAGLAALAFSWLRRRKQS